MWRCGVGPSCVDSTSLLPLPRLVPQLTPSSLVPSPSQSNVLRLVGRPSLAVTQSMWRCSRAVLRGSSSAPKTRRRRVNATGRVGSRRSRPAARPSSWPAVRLPLDNWGLTMIYSRLYDDLFPFLSVFAHASRRKLRSSHCRAPQRPPRPRKALLRPSMSLPGS